MCQSFLRVFAVTLVTLSANVYAESVSIRFKNLSRDDGLSQSFVLSIAQDEKGFMWLGTQSGLNRYDGHEFKVYRHDPLSDEGLPSNTIRALLLDDADTLWVGTDRGLAKREGGGSYFQRVSLSEFSPQPFVRTIYKDSSGNIWIGTDGEGIYRIDAVSDQLQHNLDALDELSRARIWSIKESSDDYLWIGTENGLYRYNSRNNQLRLYQSDAADEFSLAHNHVRTIHEDQFQQIWVGTENGLNRLTGEGTFEQVELPGKASNTPQVSQVSKVYEDHSGRLWVGTFGGLYLLERESDSFQHYQHLNSDPHSLANNTVLCIFEDEGNVLWFGTYQGVDRWNTATGAMHHYTQANTANNLRNDTIATFEQNQQESIWIGTFGGGLHLFDEASAKFIPFLDQLPRKDRTFLENARVMSLKMDRSGALWIGTRNSGLVVLTQAAGRLELAYFLHDDRDQQSLSSNSISAILEDSFGLLWVATFGGGMNRFDPINRQFKRYLSSGPEPAGLTNDDILTLFEDHERTLWVGTQSGGLNFYNRANDTFQSSNLTIGDSRFSVSSIAQDANHYLWVGTLDKGLIKWAAASDGQASEVEIFSTEHGIPDNTIYSVEHLGDDIWVSTNFGIAKLDTTDDSLLSFDMTDGLQEIEFNHGASLKSSTGHLYFGGVNGFNVFLPENIRINQHRPPARITQVLVGNQPISLDEQQVISLAHDDYLLSFRFVGLDFVSPEQNVYKYKLDGLDGSWIEAGTHRRATYTNLAPGDYQFYVQAANNHNVWGAITGPVDIHVQTAPWSTWWAYLGYLIIAASFLAVMLRGQLRRIRLANTLILTNATLEEQMQLREQKEQQLRRERDRVRGYLEASELIHIELDEDKRVCFADTHALKLFGYELDAVKGKPIFELVSAATAQSLMQFVNDIEANADEFVVEARDQTRRNILWRSVPIVDSETGDPRLLLVGLDTTDLRQLERVIRQREKIGAMGTLAGGLAHDFNNILTAIYGYGVLISQEVNENENVSDYIAKIIQASERAKQLVDRLLTFARSEETTQHAIDLQPVIEEAGALIRGTFPSTIELKLELSQGLTAKVDAVQVHQLLMNLSTNAGKAMGTRPGELSIKCDLVTLASSDLPIGPLEAGKYVRIRVSDTGVGIESDKLEEIFNPFFTTSDHGYGGEEIGTGLGLAVVQSIVTAHRGHIAVESVEGQGSIFTIYIPHCELSEVPVVEASSPMGTTIADVVIVDDDLLVGEVGRAILEKLGYSVTLFHDPFLALDYLASMNSDQKILVTDETMPGMSGTELLRRVRLNNPDIPVILASGNLRPFERDDGVFFMRKPYTIEAYQETLELALTYKRGV